MTMQEGLDRLREARAAFRVAKKPLLVEETNRIIEEIEEGLYDGRDGRWDSQTPHHLKINPRDGGIQ